MSIRETSAVHAEKSDGLRPASRDSCPSSRRDCTTSGLIAGGRHCLPAYRRRDVPGRRAVGRGLGARAAAGLAAVGIALLLSAGAAQAQTSVKLVSNTLQAAGTTTNTRFIKDRAQAFTTGSNPYGYTLTRLDLPMSFNGIPNPTAPAYTVKIHNATSSDPGSALVGGTLTNPASVIQGTNSYTTDGIDLEPNTTYFVVIDVTGENGNHHRISNDITISGNEDSGAYAGWSIANGSRDRDFDSSGGWIRPSYSWKMALHGIVKIPAPPAAPAMPTLSKTDGTSLTVTWTEPASAVPAVTDYDVRYRRKGDAAWTDHPHDGTALTTTITGLMQGASWEAQVAASSAGGPGPLVGHRRGPHRPGPVREGGDGRDWAVVKYFPHQDSRLSRSSRYIQVR